MIPAVIRETGAIAAFSRELDFPSFETDTFAESFEPTGFELAYAGAICAERFMPIESRSIRIKDLVIIGRIKNLKNFKFRFYLSRFFKDETVPNS
jgi:hypothetical protein